MPVATAEPEKVVEQPVERADDIFTPEPEERAKPEPEPVPVATQPEAEPEAAPAAVSPPSKHPVDLVQQALALQMSPEEIETFQPEELKRTLAAMDRWGQQVYSWSQKPAPAEKPEPEPESAKEPDALTLLAQVEAEGMVDPRVLKILRDSTGGSAKVQALEKELAELKKGHQQSSAEAVTQRVSGLIANISPDLTKQFDRSTQAGKMLFSELMGAMGAVYQHEQQTGRQLDEPTRLKRALGVIGVTIPTKPAPDPEAGKKAELEKRGEQWSQNALGKPNVNGGKLTYEDLVREKLRKLGLPISKKQEKSDEVDWLD